MRRNSRALDPECPGDLENLSGGRDDVLHLLVMFVGRQGGAAGDGAGGGLARRDRDG